MRALTIAVLAVLCSQPAVAGVPSPPNSSVDPCLIVCPAGDFAFHVTVRDVANLPVANSSVQVDLCSCPVHVCDGLCIVSGLTNAAGEVVFNIKAGGTCAGAARIIADGVFLASRSVASPDQNSDLIVDAADYATAVGKLGNSDPTADFDCDGGVTNADLAVIYDHAGHACQPIPTQTQSWGRTKAIYR